MAKTETNVSKLKINRGTYANIQANIGQIGNDELIIITDKQVPIPAQADAGKVVTVNSSGDYELQTPSAGMSNPMTTAGDLIVGGSSGTPTRLGVGTSGQVLKSNGSGIEWGSAGGIDSDVTVEIESDYTNDSYASRTNYATAISLQDFIANCEAGNVYTNAGTIAKINNLINGKAFRLLLIGTNHEVLAYDDTTTAKTTWQFLDMPEHNIELGLPLNLLDWNRGSGRQYLMDYLNGINSSSMDLYPSNKRGLISAQGLLEASHSIFESLPDTLKRHIKTVRRYYYKQRNTMSVDANGAQEYNSGEMHEFACNLFHLAGTDLGTTGPAGEGSGSQYTYFNSNARRIRFYNGTAGTWWNATSESNSYRWGAIYIIGSYFPTDTYSTSGVAPAFCI